MLSFDIYILKSPAILPRYPRDQLNAIRCDALRVWKKISLVKSSSAVGGKHVLQKYLKIKNKTELSYSTLR